MTAYAIIHLRTLTMGPPIVEYLERIDATLEPFGGRFLVHGAEIDVREGDWPGKAVVLAFPDVERARGWYESPAYRDILPLRTGNSTSDVIFVEGVPDEYRAPDLLAGH
ncbi:DUF1330 domain-containing protein [Streptomyces sp. NPDC055299]